MVGRTVATFWLMVSLAACSLLPPAAPPATIADGTLLADIQRQYGKADIVLPAPPAGDKPAQTWIYRYDGPQPTVPQMMGNPPTMQLVPLGRPERRALVLQVSGGILVSHTDLSECGFDKGYLGRVGGTC